MEYSKHFIQEVQLYCMSLPGAYESRPFGEYPICYRVMGKIFVQFHSTASFFRLTVKSKPEDSFLYRELYPGVIVRGYHCPPVQQPYWNTINLDLLDDETIIWNMIDKGYEAVIKKLPKNMKQQLGELTQLEFRYTDGNNADFNQLCNELDQTLDEMVGGKIQRKQYQPLNLTDQIHDVIVVYDNQIPVACGSFRFFDEERAELKRMYVNPNWRDRGIGAELIRRLEAQARIKGYRWFLLETGEILEAACHLYQKCGYQVMQNYGPYVNLKASICMCKKL